MTFVHTQIKIMQEFHNSEYLQSRRGDIPAVSARKYDPKAVLQKTT